MNPNQFAHQDIQFHRETAGSYDETVIRIYRIYHAYSLHPFLDTFRRDERPLRVLDLGCGTGAVALALAARGFRTFAIDHSPEMLAIARKKAEVAKLPSTIQFLTGDVERLSLRDEEFDGVVCQGLLHHLQDMGACLGELSRVLKPQGFFYISEPCQERTVISRVIRRGGRAARSLLRRDGLGATSGEAPISSRALFKMLDGLGLTYHAEYLTHLPLPYRYLSDSARLFIARALSRPWRRTQGDLVFVYGRKP